MYAAGHAALRSICLCARAQLGGWLDAPETIPLDDAAAAAAGVSCGSWAPRRIQEAERAAASGPPPGPATPRAYAHPATRGCA